MAIRHSCRQYCAVQVAIPDRMNLVVFLVLPEIDMDSELPSEGLSRTALLAKPAGP
jgi:hypothetical protein